MKYILNILVVGMLGYCSVGWSMFLKSSGQGLSYVQRKRLERIEQQRKQVSEAKEILKQHSQNIQDMLKELPGAEFNKMDFRASDQTIINLAQVYSNITQEYDQLEKLLQNKSMSCLVGMVNLDERLDMKSTKKEDLKQIVLNRIKEERLSRLEEIKGLNPDYAKNLVKELIKKEKIDVKLLKLYSNFLFSKKINVTERITPSYGKLRYFDSKNDVAIYIDACLITGVERLLVQSKNALKKIRILPRNDRNDICTLEDPYEEIRQQNGTKFIVAKNNKFCMKRYFCSGGECFCLINFNSGSTRFFDKELKDFCFYGDDDIYTVDEDGTVYAIEANNPKDMHKIIKLDISSEEKPHSITSNDAGTVILVATKTISSTHLYMIDNKDEKKITCEELPLVGLVDPIYNMKLNHVGSFCALFLGRISSCCVEHSGADKSIYMYNVGQKKLEEKLDIKLGDIVWTKDDAYRTCNYVTGHFSKAITSSVVNSDSHNEYDFLKSGDDSLVSSDGTQCILWLTEADEKEKTIYQVSLYDDLVKKMIEYFARISSISTSSSTVQADFLAVKLLHTILNVESKENFQEQLDDTEKEVYELYIPQEIKIILEKSLAQLQNKTMLSGENTKQSYSIGYTLYSFIRAVLIKLYNAFSIIN